MLKKMQQTYKYALVFLSFLLLSGCWDKIDLKELSIVTAISLDQADEPGEIVLTVHIIKPSSFKSGKEGSGGSQGKSNFNVQGRGATIYDALINIMKKVPKTLYFSHNELLIFGEAVAEKGLGKYIDFFIREHEHRRTVSVIVVKGKANELMNETVNLENTPAQELKQLITYHNKTSQSPIVDLQQFVKPLLSKTTSSIAPVMKVNLINQKKVAAFVGTALFKKDKLVAYLNQKQTKGFMFTLGKAEDRTFHIDAPGCKGEIAFHFISISRKIHPELDSNNQVKMNIHILNQVSTMEQACAALILKPDSLKIIKNDIAEQITNEIKSALKEAKTFNTDIFGFGEAVERKYPKRWKTLEKDWDKLFSKLEIEVTVTTKVKGTGVITKSIMSEKG